MVEVERVIFAADKAKAGFDDSRRMYFFLMFLTMLSAAGFQGWSTLINNFAVEMAHIDGQQMGLVQSLREVPGFLSLLVIYLLFVFQEHRLAVISVIILGLGIALTGLLPTFHGVILSTMIMSVGFHYFETINQSLTLQYFAVQHSPLVFGKLRSITAASNIGVGLFIFLAASHLSYSQIFGGLGGIIMLAAALCLLLDPLNRNIVPQHKRMIFKRRYWLYYALTFMAGARRQIFVAFAVFLLVQKFHYSVQAVTILFVVNNLVNYFLNPLIGRAINYFGERKVLSLEYSALFVIFFMYAHTDSRLIVGLMYILDHIFFNFAIAIRTYFQKIADPKDIAASMAVGFTINHIAAVFIPAIGGLLWMVDYKIPFWAGMGMSLISLILTQAIRLPAISHSR
jgi:predicted MFS family arabinose efflux permease